MRFSIFLAFFLVKENSLKLLEDRRRDISLCFVCLFACVSTD